MRKSLTRRSTAAFAEWPLLAIAAPLLLFPSAYTPAGLGLIAVGWMLRRWATGRWMVPSSANGPCLIFLGTLLLSLVPSTRLEYSAPKFWGILLGVAVFFTCLNTCGTDVPRRLVSALFLVAGAGLAIVGVLGMAEPSSKIFPLTPGVDYESPWNIVYDILPRRVGPTQSSTRVVQGINPNEVGGMLTLLVPFAAAFSIGWKRLRPLAVPCALVLVAALLLTQSRGAIVGVAVALLVGALWGLSSKARWVAFMSLAAVFAGATAMLSYQMSPFLPARLEFWQRAFIMLLDMPLTGIGLNTFPIILPRFYSGTGPGDETPIPHAHNLFLQTGLDLGLVGLAAFLAIGAVAVRRGLKVAKYRQSGGPSASPAESEARIQDSSIAIGLILGLLAHGLYGLSDAVALGAKPSPVLWIALGLLAAGSPSAGPAARTQTGSGPALHRLPAVAAAVRHIVFHFSRALIPGAALLFGVASMTPLSVNAVRVVLHHLAAPVASAQPAVGALVEGGLQLGSALAWGPYPARVQAARELAILGPARPAGSP